MRVIPNYRLYGDHEPDLWARAYFLEAIPWRANRYNNDIRPHVHSAFVQLLYMRTGTVEVLLDQEKIRAHAPCLIIVPAHIVHAFNFSDDVDGPVVTAGQSLLESMAQIVMPDLVAFIRSPAVASSSLIKHSAFGTAVANDLCSTVNMTQPLNCAHLGGLDDLFDLLERESAQQSPERVAIGMSLVMSLVASFARLMRPIMATGAEALSADLSVRTASTVTRFRSLLDLRFREHLSIEKYAAELGISPGHLSRVCREALGISAQDVVSRRVVYAAQRDLIYTNLPIKQLASTLGFTDENYFSRFFRKHSGVSPKDFRQQAIQTHR